MNRDTAVNLIAQRCGKRTDLLEQIISEMQAVQETILEAHHWLPWFLESEFASTTTEIGEERVKLPEDFLAEIDDQHLWVQKDDKWTELKKLDYDVALAKWPETGAPEAWDISNEYILIRPEPDALYPLKMRFYQRAAPLTTNIENVWLKYASALVIAEVGTIIAGRYIQNADLGQRFANEALQEWERLYKRHVAAEEVNAARTMGDE